MKAQRAVFNHLLAQHPEARAELAALAGRRVAFSLPPLTVSGEISAEGWLGECDQPAQAHIRVSPLAALAAQWTGQSPDFTDLVMTGDAELGQCFGRVLGRLRWSPTEDLSRLLGDVGAYRLERAAGQLSAFNRQLAARLAESLAEYLRDEAPLLAHKRDVDHFIAAVDHLRDDAARLEKRLARLEAGRQSGSEPQRAAGALCG